jgi:hypothetical protein
MRFRIRRPVRLQKEKKENRQMVTVLCGLVLEERGEIALKPEHKGCCDETSIGFASREHPVR